MKTQFDALENQLNSFRPSPLPTSTRRRIQHEMERPVTGSRSVSWLFGHHAGLQIAMAGALSLALVIGWNWFPRSSPAPSRGDTVALAGSTTLLPSWASWGTKLAAACPMMGENTVAVLRSPSILTNIQIRR
ncbi:MAG: hypothetical protein ABSD58_15745 [Verrucomicrobiia bacterium]